MENQIENPTEYQPVVCKKIKLDDENLPESNQESTYTSNPISSFAKNALMSMGWKEGETIGRNKKNGLLHPIQYLPRPQGMGLGAIPKNDILKMIKDGKIVTQDDLVAGKTKSYYNIGGENLKEEESKAQFGNIVEITEGRYSGLLGMLKEVDEKNKIAQVELQISQKNVQVNLKHLRKEIKKKIIKRVKEAEGKKLKKKKKKRRPLNWVSTDIILRIVSREYKEGKYFEVKGRVTDIISATHFSFYTESGEILDDLKESQVETVMPQIGQRVKILRGENKRQNGRLIAREKKKNKVQIQIEDTFDVVEMTQDDCSAC